MKDPSSNTGPTVLPGAAGSMPYVGIASFMKSPIVTAAMLSNFDFVIVGIPFDEGTSNRPGARFGPRGVRAASALYSYEGGAELFDIELGRTILEGARLGDFGDVRIEPLDGDANRAAMTAAVAAVLAAGAIPVCVGGDHSVTAPILRAHAAARGDSLPYLVHLDTHMDFDSYGSRHYHGTPVRRSVEDRSVCGVTQVGIRGFNSGKTDWEEARALGVQVITCSEFKSAGVQRVLETVPAGAPLYLSIDIDAFDPSIAPGTGTPEPGGLTYLEGRELLRALARHGDVVGIDLVEVSPPYDHAECTSILASRLLLDLMGAVWDNGEEKGSR
ncbi:MAG TPA: agmatinase [Thermoleophilia bacterium]|nr:agmatinase [Thermoleophilia bacterium]